MNVDLRMNTKFVFAHPAIDKFVFAHPAMDTNVVSL